MPHWATLPRQGKRIICARLFLLLRVPFIESKANFRYRRIDLKRCRRQRRRRRRHRFCCCCCLCPAATLSKLSILLTQDPFN